MSRNRRRSDLSSRRRPVIDEKAPGWIAASKADAFDGGGAGQLGQHRLGGSNVEGALTEGREDQLIELCVRSVAAELQSTDC